MENKLLERVISGHKGYSRADFGLSGSDEIEYYHVDKVKSIAEAYHEKKLEQYKALAELTSMGDYDVKEGLFDNFFDFNSIFKDTVDGGKIVERLNAKAEAYALERIKELQDWKESAKSILNAINLQECGKEMNLKPGVDIAAAILPWIRKVKEDMKNMAPKEYNY